LRGGSLSRGVGLSGHISRRIRGPSGPALLAKRRGIAASSISAGRRPADSSFAAKLVNAGEG
jgi:hypothetical protein